MTQYQNPNTFAGQYPQQPQAPVAPQAPQAPQAAPPQAGFPQAPQMPQAAPQGYPQQPQQPQQPPAGYAPATQAPGYAPGGYPAPQAQPTGGYGQQPQMPAPPMDNSRRSALAAAIAGAEAGGQRLPSLPAGTHTVAIDRCEFKSGRNGDDFFIVEMVVRSSDQPSVPEGGKFSYLQKLSGTSREPGLAAVKRFLLACSGGDASSPEQVAAIDLNNVEAAVSPQQPLRGVEMLVVGTAQQTRAQKWITVYQWQPAHGATAPAPAAAPAQQQYQQPPQAAPQYQQPPAHPGAPQYQMPPQGVPQGAPQGAPQGYAPLDDPNASVPF